MTMNNHDKPNEKEYAVKVIIPGTTEHATLYKGDWDKCEELAYDWMRQHAYTSSDPDQLIKDLDELTDTHWAAINIRKTKLSDRFTGPIYETLHVQGNGKESGYAGFGNGNFQFSQYFIIRFSCLRMIIIDTVGLMRISASDYYRH